MKKTAFPKYAASLTPYVAVVLGLYVFKSALIAIAIYYSGILLFIVIDGSKGLLRAILSGWNSLVAGMFAIVCAVSGIVIFLLWPYAKLENVNLVSTLADFGLSGTTCCIFLTAVIILNPLLEELFWRGCFQSKPGKPAFIDFVFAGYHVLALILVINLPTTALAFFTLSGASWGLRFIKHKLGGLAVPYIAHLVADLSIIAGIYFLINR